MEFHAVLGRMAVRLANLVKDRQHVHLDSKLLEQFMKVLQSSPMYGNGDEKSMEMYMSIAAKVDDITAMAQNLAAPPPTRRRDTNASNNGGYISQRPREDNNEGSRGMHMVDRRTCNSSPMRRAQSPERHEQYSTHRDESPVRQHYGRRDESPTRQHQGQRNESPIRQSSSRRDESPVRQYQGRRNESPIRRDQSPVRREYSPVRREYSPIRRESPVRQPKGRPDESPFRRDYVPEYSSRGARRPTTSGSPVQSSSGRRSTLHSGSSNSRSGRRYQD
jgi:hypothetical protein